MPSGTTLPSTCLNQYQLRAPAAERQSVAGAFVASSLVNWQHSNPHGEFDLTDDALKNFLHVDFETLCAFHWELRVTHSLNLRTKFLMKATLSPLSRPQSQSGH